MRELLSLVDSSPHGLPERHLWLEWTRVFAEFAKRYSNVFATDASLSVADVQRINAYLVVLLESLASIFPDGSPESLVVPSVLINLNTVHFATAIVAALKCISRLRQGLAPLFTTRFFTSVLSISVSCARICAVAMRLQPLLVPVHSHSLLFLAEHQPYCLTYAMEAARLIQNLCIVDPPAAQDVVLRSQVPMSTLSAGPAPAPAVSLAEELSRPPAHAPVVLVQLIVLLKTPLFCAETRRASCRALLFLCSDAALAQTAVRLGLLNALYQTIVTQTSVSGASIPASPPPAPPMVITAGANYDHVCATLSLVQGTPVIIPDPVAAATASAIAASATVAVTAAITAVASGFARMPVDAQTLAAAASANAANQPAPAAAAGPSVTDGALAFDPLSVAGLGATSAGVRALVREALRLLFIALSRAPPEAAVACSNAQLFWDFAVRCGWLLGVGAPPLQADAERVRRLCLPGPDGRESAASACLGTPSWRRTLLLDGLGPLASAPCLRLRSNTLTPRTPPPPTRMLTITTAQRRASAGRARARGARAAACSRCWSTPIQGSTTARARGQTQTPRRPRARPPRRTRAPSPPSATR